MKLNELAAQRPLDQVAKVFENYSGTAARFDSLNRAQTRHMLARVRTVINETRHSPKLHQSERDPGYLKLMMIEQGLNLRLQELQESEVQQAQVVLAAQDLVDSVQSMLEDVSEMQFKELPALVDSIRNQVGTAQADQFNTDATAALQGMLQNLQGGKQQLETALAVVTGQGPAMPAIPGADMSAAPMPGAEPGADNVIGVDAEADLDLDVDDDSGPEQTLGRARR
jgi:autonomous glycyl radical cofactor GrcA